MTSRDQQFQSAVVDGGALGAAAIAIATREVVAGFQHADLASPALLDLLLGTTRPVGPLTQACGGTPPSAARELLIAGAARSLFCAVLERGELIVMAAPATMSVALGWALVRTLVATQGGA
ncbi:MAG TPA: hypothetical protein VFP84_10775 [Kofleriaceae bacterium]|nr:hypothetical protein [Kofleriaceae bacterium]